jgi:hypothetical protein
MVPKCLILFVLILSSGAALAQGTQQPNPGVQSRVWRGLGISRPPVATQPSNNPFQNPIGQGVPPAASTNPYLNSNRTNVPTTR